MESLVIIALVLLLIAGAGQAAPDRAELLSEALTHWPVAQAFQAGELAAQGEVTVVAAPGEPGNEAVDCAGTGFLVAEGAPNATGEGITVFVRAQAPGGEWQSGLFAKRIAGHETINFNLWCATHDPAIGPVIGFELTTEHGFGVVSFPVSQIDPKAWHSLVGRYDGQVLELICDDVPRARAHFAGGALLPNDQPVIIGADGPQGRPFKGLVSEAAVWDRALGYEEIAVLNKVEALMPGPEVGKPVATSIIHYRPEEPAWAGDPIPFYWNGRYHLFYLEAGRGAAPWAHIVSTDLVHWERLPYALLPGADPQGPDAEGIWTGSVIEHEGVFHTFYTGKNMAHPEGDQKVMHATSGDLLNWTKRSEWTFYADGLHYWSKPINGSLEGIQIYHHQAFRDPEVFYNPDAGCWWLLLHACRPDGEPVFALYTSDDLISWIPQEPLVSCAGAGMSGDCPHYVQLGHRSYIISAGHNFVWAEKPEGPYSAVNAPFDAGLFTVPKGMFDGKRHLLVGWLNDLEGFRDEGGGRWGGTLSMAREVYAGPRGELFQRPCREVIDYFDTVALDRRGVTLAMGESLIEKAPADGMVVCKLVAVQGATAKLTFRAQGGESEAGYTLSLDFTTGKGALASQFATYEQDCGLKPGQEVEVRAFVLQDVLEVFVDDAYCFTMHCYNWPEGALKITAEGAVLEVRELTAFTTSESED